MCKPRDTSVPTLRTWDHIGTSPTGLCPEEGACFFVSTEAADYSDVYPKVVEVEGPGTVIGSNTAPASSVSREADTDRQRKSIAATYVCGVVCTKSDGVTLVSISTGLKGQLTAWVGFNSTVLR